MYPESVSVARVDIRDIPVVHESRGLGKSETGLESEVIEQAELDSLSVFGEDGEIGAGTIPCGTLGVGPSRPYQCAQEFPSGR